MSGMRPLLEAIADELLALSTIEVEDVVTHRPIWRNPDRGKVLYVYVQNEDAAGGYNTTKSVEDRHEVWLEYVEPATEQAQNLERNEEIELEALEVGHALRAWVRENRGTFASLDTPVHKFEYSDTSYNPQNELLVRYSRTRCWAYTHMEYEDQ